MKQLRSITYKETLHINTKFKITSRNTYVLPFQCDFIPVLDNFQFFKKNTNTYERYLTKKTSYKLDEDVTPKEELDHLFSPQQNIFSLSLLTKIYIKTKTNL